MCGVKPVRAGSLSQYALGRKKTPPADRKATEAGSGVERMRSKLNVDNASYVHPSGKCIDEIKVPSRCKASFFHIPGIATVKGIAFTPGGILARPPNVLVFGLTKQEDAMLQSAAVARAIQSNLAMAEACVVVVGKVFKDFKHNAIAAPVERRAPQVKGSVRS
jgi:hypothetical protein